MKKFSLILVLAMVANFAFSQTVRDYVIDEVGNVKEVTNQSPPKITLTFDADVPLLSENQLSILLEKGKVVLKYEKIKGHYEQGILFYVPRVSEDICLLSLLKDGRVSYLQGQERDEDKVFSWWFLLLFLGVLSIIIFQMKSKNVVWAMIGAMAVAGAVAVSLVGAGGVVVLGAVLGALVGAVFGAVFGALLGALVGDVLGALVGAVFGAVFGALLGALVGAVFGTVILAVVLAMVGIIAVAWFSQDEEKKEKKKKKRRVFIYLFYSFSVLEAILFYLQI